jgi:tRNA threonylcarbamoyladenosine biosynthesis protein TsaB
MSPEVCLGVDAATDRLSVAVARGGEPPVEVSVLGARRHAAALPGLAADLLAKVHARIEDVQVVAVADGPGGFTGLRVAAAFAKALTAGRDVALHTAPSLLLRAMAASTAGERVLALSPALRGEVYAGIWHLPGDRIDILLQPLVLGARDIAELPDVDRVIGRGPAAVMEAVENRFATAARNLGEHWPSAGVLLGLVQLPGGTERVDDVATWQPVYGRLAEAQTVWEQRHGRPLPDPDRTTG